MFLSLPQGNFQTSASGTFPSSFIEASSMEALGLWQAGSIGELFLNKAIWS